jgi:hypothetical protein
MKSCFEGTSPNFFDFFMRLGVTKAKDAAKSKDA